MAAATTTTAAAFRETDGGWVRSAGWDLFWMFSALWGSALLFAAGFSTSLQLGVVVLFLGNRAIAVAHSWSTTYMVLGSPLLREERRQNPRKFVHVPLLIVLGCFALGYHLTTIQTFPRDGRVPLALWSWALYISLFWVGHFWHFGNQDFGVLSLYRAKSGQVGLRDRRVDKLYCVLMMFVIQPIVFLKAVSYSAFSEVVYSYLALPPWLVQRAADVGIAVALVASALVLSRELARPRRSVPKLGYYAVMAVHPVVLYFSSQGFASLYMVTYFWSHWFVAIGLVSRINTGFYRSRGDAPWRSVVRHALTLGAIVAGVLLLTHGFSEYNLLSGGRHRDVLNGFRGHANWIVTGFLGFFLAEQLLHYYCDRCLFRFRDPAIRRKVASLL